MCVTLYRPEDDIRHWTKFPSFSALQSHVEVDGGKSLDLSNYQYIFMVTDLIALLFIGKITS